MTGDHDGNNPGGEARQAVPERRPRAATFVR
jgi:hypothetical protein